MSRVKSDIVALAEMKSAGAFQHYIDYIRFPFFRNLERGTRIDFEFPLCAFVGPNGCGKSSALQALYGCPKGKSLSTYWFNTEVDPIAELSGSDRHCLIYSYEGQGAASEVLKTRINKAGQPDLWDTSEPIARYEMQLGARTPPIEKEVVYINFRAVRSAFEAAFNESQPPWSGIQNWLRQRSNYLDRALRGRTIPRFRGWTHDDVVELTGLELEWMSNILGRSYTAAKLVRHRFFGGPNYSALLQTAHARYSEAFAGSGETAVALLINSVVSAPEDALMLLDEPETSLHPGAQRRVLEFLADQSKRKRYQIVFCTHAPAMVEGLPSTAIKCFSPTAAGTFRVVQGVLHQEAFAFLGQPLENKTVLRVEDQLSFLLVEAALAQLSEHTRSLFDVRFSPGGETAMKRDAVVYSRENTHVVLLFDGDKKPAHPIFDPDTLTVVENATAVVVDTLNSHIEAAIGMHVDFDTDAEGIEKQRQARKHYLKYLLNRVFFLPFVTPEEAIWDDEVAVRAAENFLNADTAKIVANGLEGEADYKKKFAILSEAIVGSAIAGTIVTVHKLFVTHWASTAPASFSSTVEMLQTARDRLE